MRAIALAEGHMLALDEMPACFVGAERVLTDIAVLYRPPRLAL